ncbi:putative Ig domain-containing protein, partial [Larkinella knui]
PVPPAVSPLAAVVHTAFSSAPLPVFTDPEQSPLTYELTGLPSPLSFNASSRVVSGTPTTSGTFSLTYSATDQGGAKTPLVVSLVVSPAPPANTAPVAPAVSSLTATVNVAYATTLPVFTDAQNDPLTYTLTGLPAPLSFNATTRVIAGTPTASGTFPLTYSASDGLLSQAVSIALTVNTGGTTPPAPAANYDGYLAKDLNCTTLSGWAWERAKGNAVVTIEFFQGASIATGQLLGTTAANIFRQDLLNAGKGNGEHGFDFAIPEALKDGQPRQIWARVQGSEFILKDAPKTLTCGSPGTPPPTNTAPVAPAVGPLTATVNVAFTASALPVFTDAQNDPLTYTLTGLPAPLSFNATTRVISGTPTASGTFTLTYSASDGQLAQAVTLTLTVNTGGTTPPAPAANYDGYLAKDLNCTTLSGWAWERAKGNAVVTIEFFQGASIATGQLLGTTAANIFRQDLLNAGKGNGEHGFDFAIPEALKDGQPRQIWARVQGSEFILKDAPKTLTCGSPGTPPPANTAPVAPAVGPLTATVNGAFTTTLPVFTDAQNDPLTYTLTGLPAPLTFNATTRVISGTPTASGTFTLTYSASDGPLSQAVTLTLTVNTGGTTPPPTSSGSGPGNYEGYLDIVNCSSIQGWIWDRNRPNTPITVEFVDGTSVVGSTDAGLFRPDLKTAGKGDGNHGYSFEVPASLRDGKPHAISGRVPASGYTLKWSPKTLTCPSGSRQGVEQGGTQVRLALTVSPNPSRGRVEVSYEVAAGQWADLQVVDLLGRSLWEKALLGSGQPERQTIDLSGVAPAVYLLQLQTAKQIVTKRLLINR